MHTKENQEDSTTRKRGALGFSVSHFWFGFSDFALWKLRFVGFGVLGGLRVFSNLAFGFRFLSTMMAVFLDFSVQCIQYGFSGFAEEVTPCSRAKTVIPRDNLYSVLPFLLDEWMPSLVFLADVCCIDYFSNIWDNILRTLTLDCTILGKKIFRWLAPFTFVCCKMWLPLCLHQWKYWQWQSKSNFGMWCSF